MTLTALELLWLESIVEEAHAAHTEASLRMHEADIIAIACADEDAAMRTLAHLSDVIRPMRMGGFNA